MTDPRSDDFSENEAAESHSTLNAVGASPPGCVTSCSYSTNNSEPERGSKATPETPRGATIAIFDAGEVAEGNPNPLSLAAETRAK